MQLRNEIIEAVLNYIDKNITDNINVGLIAEKAGYSAYHFSRIFSGSAGISLIAYVTWRKLQFALYDISKGEKIIDTAVKYGFETHGGFTKAFKKCFGFPPSLYILRVSDNPPCEISLETLQTKFKNEKGNLLFMTPYIIEMTPFTVAGRTLKQKLPNVKITADIPAFVKDEDNSLLDNTSILFSKSNEIKHCEVEMCYDVNPNTGEFTFLVGRGIFHPDDFKNILSEMVSFEIKGLYAIFTTTPVPFEDEELYAKTIRDTWNHILIEWLPNSEFEYDETRKDYEYYDYRCHGHYFGNKRQMDICIPIRQRVEAKRISQERGEILWAEKLRKRELKEQNKNKK